MCDLRIAALSAEHGNSNHITSDSVSGLMMAKGKKRNLERALGIFLNQEKLNGFLTQVLIKACKTGKVSYDEIEEIASGDSEDVLLLGFEWRLLIPTRSTRDTLEWEDALLLAKPGETYKMPNVVKYLVEEAIQTGRWEPESAIAEIFKVMGEPEWDKMQNLVQKLGEESQYYRTNATQIKKICRELDLEDRVNSLIAELKGSGVMSPRVSSLAEVIREGSPIYELNPCLFTEKERRRK